MYFEDCLVGDRVIGPARTITETDLVQFAGLTGDWNPLHTDAEYARGTEFGDRIAHGMLVLAVASGLLYRAGASAALPQETIAFAGVDRVRFVAPVRIGDTVHVETEVKEVREIDGERGVITASHRVVNERGATVLTFSGKILARRRPPGTDGPAHG
ncbi:MAG: MaoC family dehydratase N-terminal domain-containing protein [Candidatus Rokubacteria bacterium]|nr:MaoC family dehydratase N-terminal domain-containing protein [Candidatus Rokubacteria bacterium]